MAAVLHLVTRGASTLAAETIRQQTEAGDRVTIVLLEGAAAPPVPGALVRRVPENLSYAQLLDLVFDAEQVISW